MITEISIHNLSGTCRPVWLGGVSRSVQRMLTVVWL